MEIIESLKWRYATKKFDASRQLSASQLELLKSGVQLSASSYGLQPYHVFVVSDKNIRASLLEAAYNQPQITDSSALFVFAVEKNLDVAHVDRYFKLISDTRGVSLADLAGYREMLLGSLSYKSSEQKLQWAISQAYIALGFLLTTAAHSGIDACPMEGFVNEKFDKILNLEPKGLTTAVLAAVGFRSPADEAAKYAKVRKPLNELFTVV